MATKVVVTEVLALYKLEYSMGIFRVKPRVKSLKIFDNWNIAYSGAKVECVRKILDTGDLLSIGKYSFVIGKYSLVIGKYSLSIGKY